MPTTTIPPIAVAQNGERAQYLLAAQRRLYSDAKMINAARLAVIAVGACLGILVALLLPDSRVAVGIVTGVALLVISALGGVRERRRSRAAAALQEEFDAALFQLPWNELLAERVTPAVTADAVRRYRGSPILDWYPDTKEIARPLDVLVCQQTNVAWGAFLHRAWAATIGTVLVCAVAAIGVVAVVADLTFIETLASLILPGLPLLRELIEIARVNIESGRAKLRTDDQIASLWRRGLIDPNSVTVEDCRTVQDRILTLRQTNAGVPDWFHRLLSARNSASMRISTDQLISQASEHGVVTEPNSAAIRES